MLKPIFIPIPASFTKANFKGLLFNRNRANGIDVKASILRIIPNHKIYSGCSEYLINDAILFLNKETTRTKEIDVKNTEISEVENTSSGLSLFEAYLKKEVSMP